MDDAQCSATTPKPASSQTTTDYTACSYAWSAGTYSAPSTTCGSATQTRTVSCLRSDGQTVGDDLCSAAGTKPPTSQSTVQTSSCTYSWLTGSYGSTVPACGASTHSRTVSCGRSDGQIVDASNCTSVEPATSEATTDYSTCTYDWQASTWNGSGGCGSTVTQTRTVTCVRSNGDAVPDSNCTTTKPPSSQPITDYSACSYSWNTVNGAWSNTCSSSATRTNTVTCVRQDGTVVGDAYCSGTKPATTDTQGVYSSCTYQATYGTYGSCVPSSYGSTTGSQSATIATCTRSDGTTVSNSNCTATSVKSCTVAYTPTYAAFGVCTPTSQGSTSGTESAPLTGCTAGDGSAAPSASCSSSPQTTTRTCSNIVYAETYSTTYSACSASKQSAPITGCTTTAGDGNNGSVATNLCPSTAQTTTQSCSQTCGTLTNALGASGTVTTINSGGGVTTLAAAQTQCASAVNRYGTGICRWNDPAKSVSNGGNLYYFIGGSTTSATTGSYAAVCK